MIRRLAAAKQRRCYIEIFKLIVEHKVPYTVNRNGVFFNLSLSVRRVGAADRRDHQEVRAAEATTALIDDKYTFGMVGVVLPLTRRYRLFYPLCIELLYGLRRLQQLALIEVIFCSLVSP